MEIERLLAMNPSVASIDLPTPLSHKLKQNQTIDGELFA